MAEVCRQQGANCCLACTLGYESSEVMSVSWLSRLLKREIAGPGSICLMCLAWQKVNTTPLKMIMGDNGCAAGSRS